MTTPLAVVVLAAGKGTRTRLPIPKVLLSACGRSLLDWVLGEVEALAPERTVLVLHHGKDEIEKTLRLEQRPWVSVVDQGEPRGTGHAVLAAARFLEGFHGDLLVLYGDCPLMSAATLRALVAARHGAGGEAAAAMLTAYPADPTGLGRILRDPQGGLLCIREERDCSPSERRINEINTGFYCFAPELLFPALRRVKAENVQKEYYLTDVVGILVEDGAGVTTLEADATEEVLGVNSLDQLAAARKVLQERILVDHMQRGVLIEDPVTTYIDAGVEIGAGTRILPCTVIRGGVRIAANCEVGPFAHLRVGTELLEGAEIGNFVEAKKTRVGRHTKAKHLTYLGDTEIGDHTNIGAGSITANYDGKHKHMTRIGNHAFVGSGTIIVAPAEVGDGAMTGAGALITRRTVIPPGAVYLGVPARPHVRAAGSVTPQDDEGSNR
jgi:bifunctional UDP-N-acetylglucosamine pyrophosphorylase/glucosamine-1-phosphate N-acetyltransferase